MEHALNTVKNAMILVAFASPAPRILRSMYSEDAMPTLSTSALSMAQAINALGASPLTAW